MATIATRTAGPRAALSAGIIPIYLTICRARGTIGRPLADGEVSRRTGQLADPLPSGGFPVGPAGLGCEDWPGESLYAFCGSGRPRRGRHVPCREAARRP